MRIYCENGFLVKFKAWFSSMIFPATTEKCLRFWYILSGNNVATLKVLISYEDGTQKIIWLTSVDKGNQWNEGSVSFDSDEMSYK